MCSLPNFPLSKPPTASVPIPPLVRCLTLPAAPRPPVCGNIVAPLEEEYYDVRVCLVPGELTFLVQSYMETEAYVQLQRQMNVFYGDQSNWRSVGNAELSYQALVAVLQEGRWERARVLRRVGAPMFPVSLRLVDTGRLVVRPQLQGLQPLWHQFGRLAEQAAVATLAGCFTDIFPILVSSPRGGTLGR